MIKRQENVVVNTENNDMGKVKMFLSDLKGFEGITSKLGMFSHVKLKVGEKVNFHMHVGECEIYYILSGKALYNDNGEKVEVYTGDVTYTPSGEGHGIENAGDSMLEFIALIVKD